MKSQYFLLSFVAAIFVFTQSVAQQPDTIRRPMQGGMQGNPLAEFEHPKNLKILPRNLSPKDLAATMRTWSKSLGVRCGFCHESGTFAKAGERPKIDFASDAKVEKRDARKMFIMMQDINRKYLQRMNKSFEEIGCVSCHHGSAKPMTSVDSLPKPAGK